MHKHMPPATSDRVKTADEITTFTKSDFQIDTIKRTLGGNTGTDEEVQIDISTEKRQLIFAELSFDCKQLLLNKTLKSSEMEPQKLINLFK